MKYVCQICGYVYDDAKEKVPFSKLPDDWKCPLCGAAKSDFKAEETSAEQIKSASVPMKRSDEKLSAGQFAALCSNRLEAVKNNISQRSQNYLKSLQIIFQQLLLKFTIRRSKSCMKH